MFTQPITEWKTRLLELAAGAFGEDKFDSETSKSDITRTQAKIGEMPLDNDF